MAWIIQSISDGPICIGDIGVTLTKNQMRDLDLMGRDGIERSNDLKMLITKGFIKEVRKDPVASKGEVSSVAMQEVQKSADKAVEAANNAMVATESLQKQITEQKQQNQEILDKTQQVLEAVQAYAKQNPMDVQVIKKALENIQDERQKIAIKKEELVESEDASDEEINLQNKLLDMKDKKLEKNFNDVGKTIIKDVKDASVDDALDAMDALGIG